jgi:hypothetical protein
MGGWVGDWLRAWRSEPVELSTPLPVEAVRERLAAGRGSRWRAGFMVGGGGYHVVGRVGRRRVALTVVRAGMRNSWMPEVRGRLEATATGSRLVARIGWSPFVKAFSAVWLGVVTAIFLGAAGRAVALAVTGEITAPDALFCLVPLAFMAFFVGLSSWGMWAARDSEAYLRSWLAGRIPADGSGIAGYRF